MEIYLTKLTKQIYERQRELDQLKLGELDKKVPATGLCWYYLMRQLLIV